MRARAFGTLLVLAAALMGPAALAANDPMLKDQWGLQKIGGPTAWGGSTGAGIVIAVVDTGVDLSHPDLAANLVGGRNFVEPGQPPSDDHGHGSHVAGIAAAVTDNGQGVAGTAPRAKVMPVRVLKAERDSQGRMTATGRLSDVDAGIRWAVDNGAHVVNLSLGEQVRLSAVTGTSSLDSAVNYAWSKGSVPVVASGNDNMALLFPSGYRNLNGIVVGATDQGDRRASFSNDVSDARWGLMAPGVAIVSTWSEGRWATASGTSMATPYVAGAVALLRAQGMTPQQAVDRLRSTAQPVSGCITCGSGRIDAAAAVPRPAAQQGAPPPGGGAPRQTAGGGTTRATPAPRTGSSPSQPGVAAAPDPETPGPSEEAQPSPDATASTEDAPVAVGERETPRRSGLANALVAGVLLTGAAATVVYLRLRRGI
ncbi:MAG TPA: S8 family serine peptidase [Actinomycetota bacterium]|nr:S8 family serine peptidase [Actinomycetota bacterium]